MVIISLQLSVSDDKHLPYTSNIIFYFRRLLFFVFVKPTDSLIVWNHLLAFKSCFWNVGGSQSTSAGTWRTFRLHTERSQSGHEIQCDRNASVTMLTSQLCSWGIKPQSTEQRAIWKHGSLNGQSVNLLCSSTSFSIFLKLAKAKEA